MDRCSLPRNYIFLTKKENDDRRGSYQGSDDIDREHGLASRQLRQHIAQQEQNGPDETTGGYQDAMTGSIE